MPISGGRQVEQSARTSQGAGNAPTADGVECSDIIPSEVHWMSSVQVGGDLWPRSSGGRRPVDAGDVRHAQRAQTNFFAAAGFQSGFDSDALHYALNLANQR